MRMRRRELCADSGQFTSVIRIRTGFYFTFSKNDLTRGINY
jgi:hypothetical protein